MRLRLVLILLSLTSVFLLALAVPLASNLASTQQKHVFVDRVEDATRFAGIAQQAGSGVDRQELDGQLARYYDTYRITDGLIDHAGNPVITHGSRAAFDDPTVHGAIAAALQGHQTPGSGIVWPWQDRPIVVAMPVRHGDEIVGVIVTVSPTGGIRSMILHSLLMFAGIIVLTFTASVASAMRLAAWALRPLRSLDAATSAIAGGRLGTRVGTLRGPGELRRFAESFNEMAQKVQQFSDRQASFAADASHQLRTPLASLMLRLENLGAELPPDHNPELVELYEEVERMHSIVEGLLQLATIDQTRLSIESVCLAELIDQRVRAAQPRAHALATKIALDTGPAGPLQVSTDCTLAGSAFEAMLDNAIKFSPQDGEVTVALAAEQDYAAVTVSDQGPGLPVKDLERIGDRFWRSSRHQNVDGTGLGLAVARSMLEAVGGTLAFAANAPSGLTVTMRLPLTTATAASSMERSLA